MADFPQKTYLLGIMKTPLAAIGLRGFPDVQGGVENHCAAILPNLGINCRVYRRKPYISQDKKPPENIRFVDLPSTRIKGFETAFHTALCVVHLLIHPVEIVNVHNIGPALLTPLLKLRGMKVVLTYHSTNYLHSKWGWFAKNVLKIGEYVGFRFADKIIFVSDTMRRNVCSSYALTKSIVIPNPVHKVSQTESTEFCKSIGVQPLEYLLAVGRISPEKGFDCLVTAARNLPDGFKVVIAGTADNGSSYMDMLKQLDSGNKVIFTGFANPVTLHELYSHARMFVLPSHFEGMSLALLEAMSYSLPICASDIPANRLPELENHAIYFAPGNPSALRNAISKAFKLSPRIDYDLNAYSPNRIITSTAAIYESLLRNSH